MTHDDTTEKTYKHRKIVRAGGSGGIWFLGFIGALAYNLQLHTGTFWLVVVACFKAVFWPAFLIYHLMLFLGM